MRGRWQIEAEIRHNISASLTGKNCPCLRRFQGASRLFANLAANLQRAPGFGSVPTRRSRNQKLNETWRQAGWKLSSKTCSLFGREILIPMVACLALRGALGRSATRPTKSGSCPGSRRIPEDSLNFPASSRRIPRNSRSVPPLCRLFPRRAARSPGIPAFSPAVPLFPENTSQFPGILSHFPRTSGGSRRFPRRFISTSYLRKTPHRTGARAARPRVARFGTCGRAAHAPFAVS